MPHGLAGGVEGRGWRLLGSRRLAVWILGQDGGRPERLDACLLPASGGFRFDVGHQSRRTPLSLLLGRILPARERIEGQDLPGGVLETAEVLPTAASCILLGVVEDPNDDLVQGQAGRNRRRLWSARQVRKKNPTPPGAVPVAW